MLCPSEVRYANGAAEVTFFDLSELWEDVSFKGIFLKGCKLLIYVAGIFNDACQVSLK